MSTFNAHYLGAFVFSVVTERQGATSAGSLESGSARFFNASDFVYYVPKVALGWRENWNSHSSTALNAREMFKLRGDLRFPVYGLRTMATLEVEMGRNGAKCCDKS